ncbi:MAG: carboxymuconolactone decarboxylase family protein [Halioglobus sp.]
MAFISIIPAEQASGDTLEMYRRQQGESDSLPNYAQVFCHRPQLMSAWANLQATIRETIEPRRYELATLAAARAIGSSYCSLAYGKTLMKKYFTEDELLAITREEQTSPLTEGERLIMKLARKTAADSSTVNREDVQALHDQGFDDGEIFDVVASAAARCFFAKLVDALGALPDAGFADLPIPVQNALVVGRAIEGTEGEKSQI